jgi:hypothetical protein
MPIFSKEFEINGSRKDFNKWSRKFEHNENYLGASNIFVINNVKTIFENVYYFYK